MESIGQLTAGIAHEFNNMLATILGFTELSIELSSDDPQSKISEYLHEIQKAGERSRDLIEKMLTYGRSSSSICQPVDGTHIVLEASQFHQQTLPSSIVFNIRIEDEIPQLWTDPLQLHQVITNLIINAHHAVSNHGEIELNLYGPHHLEGVCSSCHQPFSGKFIELSVRDNGQGIPKDKIENVFEPFFTTKDIGKGTGLGLSVVHGIVHQCNGHILLETGEGRGSNFRLLFQPALPEDSDTAASDIR